MPNNRPIWKPLRGYGAFARVLARGKAFSSGPVRCFVGTAKQVENGVAIGFGVSRSVRGAVNRNRVRRLLRESVRLHQHTIVGPPGRGKISAEIVLMYVGQNPARSSLIRRADLDNSVAQLLASAMAYCEAGNRRAGRPLD